MRVPPHGRRGHGAAAGLQVRLVGDRLPGHEGSPRPRDASPDSLAREDGAGPLRRLHGGGGAGGGQPAAHPPAPGRQGGQARVPNHGRVGARALSVQGVVRRGAGEALPRPDAGLSVHRGLPHPPDDQGGGPGPGDPQRDGGGGGAGGVLEGRVGMRAGGDQPPLRRARRDGGSPHALQARREGDRARAGQLRHVHGEVRHGRRPGRRSTFTRASGTGRASAACSSRRANGSARRSTGTGSRDRWRWPGSSHTSTPPT